VRGADDVISENDEPMNWSFGDLIAEPGAEVALYRCGQSETAPSATARTTTSGGTPEINTVLNSRTRNAPTSSMSQPMPITAPTITTGQTDGVGPAPSLRPTSLLVSNGVVVDLYSLILFGDVLTTVQVVVARNWFGAFWVVDRILVDLNALSPTTLFLVG
jgi:hypothetical protein